MAGQLAASIEEELEGDDHSQIPADYDSLCTWFERRISETRTAIVIDAIDQLPERDRFLSWLPNPLPNGVTLITGSLESNATAPLNDYWMSRATERMCLSPLDALAGGHLVNRSLARYQKTLSHDAMAALLVKPGATTPLYLRIASEELRTKGIREELVNEIAGMPGTAGGMFLWVLKRLASDPQFRWSNGTRAVDSLIGCLGVARDGLSESELVALIKHEDAFGADPEGDIAVLLQLLRPYMGRRGDRYTPVHRTFIDALHGGGLSDHDRGLLGSNHPAPLDESTEVKAAHRRLAVLFGSLPRSDTRRLAEETWHVIKSGDFKTANALLTDFDFLKKRVEAGLVRSVVEDMDCFVQEASNSEWPVTDDLRIWQRLFRRRRAFWEQFPDEFHQDCLNEAEGLPTTDAAKKNPIGKPWIRWLNKPEQEIRHPWEWMVRDASCAVFSPDGKSVAVGGTDGSLRLFDAKTGYEVWRGLAHSDRVDYVAFCPDARKVISSSKDSMSVVWDATVGRCLTKLCGHTDRVNFGEFCPDGVHAITTSNDKTIRVWELESGILQRTYQTNDGVIKVLRVSPDGNYIALAGSLGKICLISCSTWDYREFTAHAGDVTDINFSLDGCHLVTASRDRTAHVWLIPDMQRMVTINGHEDELTACCFNSDASQILTASRDGSVRLWDGLTGDELVRYTGHIGPVKSAKFSAESTTVITGSADKTSHIWNVEQQKCESILSGHESWVYDSSYHQGANRILTRSLETVRLWNTAGIVDFQRLNGHDGPVRTAVYTGDGTKVLTGSFDRTARLWDVNTGQLLQVYKGHDWYLWSAEFNADESLIVTSSFDGSARVWDTATGAEKCKLAGHTSAVRIARFSKDSQTVLTASEDSTVRTWNPVTGESKLILRGHDSYVYSATFDSHDQRVVTSSDDGTVQISTLSTEEQEPQSLVHPHWVHFAAPSPDDNLVVSVSKEKYVYLWDTPSGTMIENFQPKVQKIQNARFEGSNRIVCLGSLVSGEHLMDAETGEILSGQRLASLGCNVRSTVAMDAFGVGLTVYRPDTDIRILTHLESECIFNATVVCPTNPYSFTVGCADGSVRFFQLEGVELSEVSNI
jgi:WD40 repeat protein